MTSGREGKPVSKRRMTSSALGAVMVVALFAACGDAASNSTTPGAPASPTSAAETTNLGAQPTTSTSIESTQTDAEPTTDAGMESALAQAELGKPFRNGSFEITVTKVELGATLIDVDDDAKSGGIKGFTPENGQFIMVYLTAKNVGSEPASMSTTESTMVDANGKSFSAGGPYLFGVVGQGLGDDQQPDSTRKGWIAFDVPLSVTKVDFVIIQPDSFLGTTNMATPVKVS